MTLGYIITLLVGITLGLMGSGGSILTVPNLVYLMDIKPSLATTYSLFLVGATALIGSIKNIRNKTIDYRLLITFGLPSTLAMIITRKYILSAIPEIIHFPVVGSIEKETALMLLFATLMIVAAFTMIKTQNAAHTNRANTPNNASLMLIFQGLGIGLLSGLLGAGGGFLMIPGFVLLANVPIKAAVSSSLLLVAINSLIGFGSDYELWHSLDWNMLFIMLILSVIGIIVGGRLLHRINALQLKKGFGYFILLMGVFILYYQ